MDPIVYKDLDHDALPILAVDAFLWQASIIPKMPDHECVICLVVLGVLFDDHSPYLRGEVSGMG